MGEPMEEAMAEPATELQGAPVVFAAQMLAIFALANSLVDAGAVKQEVLIETPDQMA
jgi:hypothetical protein